jgi:hypothetical protein
MVQLEQLVLPCIVSITVALTWMTFLVKDAASSISKIVATVAFVGFLLL